MPRLILVGLLLLLAGCVGQNGAVSPGSPSLANQSGMCQIGKPFHVQGPETLVVHTPVVLDGFSVLATLQQTGPLPINYGGPIDAAAGAGAVAKYEGPGFVLVYFPTQSQMPRTLPWVDRHGICRGNTDIVASTEVRGWSYVKMKHFGYVAIPELFVANSEMLCARPWRLKVLHVPKLTGGPFKGTPNMVCSFPGSIAASLQRGHGTFFLFVAAPDQPPEWR